MPASLTYLESLRQAMHAILENDPLAVVLGEDILDPYGGAFKATRGLSSRFPERVLTTPICEASIVGIATGLALRGMHPIAEIMFGDFLTLATDQLVNHAAKYYAMYNRAVDVPLVVRTPMGGGRGYGPTHSQSLEKMYLGLHSFHILAPSHFHDVGEMLKQAVQSDRPVLFIENKLLYTLPLRLDGEMDGIDRSEVGGEDGYPNILLKNYRAPKEPDVVIIAYGGISRLLEPVLTQLGQEEIWALACLPGCLSPLAAEPILECVGMSNRVIIIEEGSLDFGWGAEVSTRVYENHYAHLAGPIRRLGAARGVIPASKPLEDRRLVSQEKIISAVFEVLQW